MKKKSLIVIRAGDYSLHAPWVSQKRESRSFDVAISYYGKHPEYWKNFCDYFEDGTGQSKFEGLSHFIRKNNSLIKQYDFIWFPDDDLSISYQDIEVFFSLCREHQWTLSQPSLMRGSYFSWSITLQKRIYQYRITNFVEVMAPCFNVSQFEEFIPSFSASSSGWGLEALWLDIAQKSEVKCTFAIVDQVAMYHTRPVGSMGSGGAKNKPEDEMLKLLKQRNLPKIKPRILGRHVNKFSPFIQYFLMKHSNRFF